MKTNRMDKRQKYSFIQPNELLELLEAQKNISASRLRTNNTTYNIPDITSYTIRGDDQEYRVSSAIGYPGAFGAGWKASKLTSSELMSSINDVVRESSALLLKAVEDLIQATSLLEGARVDSTKIEDVKKAVRAFEDILISWKSEFDQADDLKIHARDQILHLCCSYIQKAGFKSRAGQGVCYPCISKLENCMKDFRKMIKDGRVDFEETVFLKTFYIPSEKFHSVPCLIQRYVSRVQRELDCLKEMQEKKFSHENVAKIHHVFINAQVLDREKKSIGSTVCIVQELVDGGIDLYEWVNDLRRDTHARFDTRAALDYSGVARYFFRSLMEAVAAMHDRRIYHYDIKIENIMVSRTTKALKLIDFGLGKVLRDVAGGGDRLHSIDAPEAAYLAPEVRGAQKGHETVPEFADVWCCGVVLLAITVPVALTVQYCFDELLAAQPGHPKLRERIGDDREDGPALKDLLSR